MFKLGRVISLCFLTISAWSVFAQTWEYVTSANENSQYYYDPVSVKQIGDEVKFMQLSNHPDGFSYDGRTVYSIKSLRVINCHEKLYKSEYLLAYSKAYGGGDIEVFNTNLKDKWVREVPESVAYFMRLKVCS